MVNNAQSQIDASSASRTSFRADAPQFNVDDRPDQGARRCSVTARPGVRDALDLSRLELRHQFNKFGRVFQVYVQADAPFRLRPDDIAEPDGAQQATAT